MRTPIVSGVLGLVAAIALAAAIWIFSAASEGGEDALRIDSSDAELVALGRDVYARECAACHGADLQGQPDWRRRGPDGKLPAPPHDPTGHTWHHPDGQLFALTRDGVAPYAPLGYATDMPGFGDRLSDREIRASLAYIKSRWPADIRARQEEITRRAEAPGS